MHDLIRHLRQHRFALTAAGVALLGTLLAWPLSQRFPFALFIAAVMVSAWRGGLRPGLVTTGVSTLALLLLFLLFPSVRDAEPGEHFVLRLGMFVLIGVLAGYLSMKCKEAVVAHDRFHDSIASLGEALIFTDVRGNITFLNPTAQMLTGCAEAKPLGHVITLLQEVTRQPLDDPAGRAVRDNVPSALPEGTLLVSADKRETPIEGKVIPLRDADERLVGVAVAFHTAAARRQMEQELRQREQRFRAALGGSPAALLLLDAKGHCLFTNRACQSLGGFTFDEGLGQGWTRCIHLDDRDRLLTEWTAAVPTEAGTFSGEFRRTGGRDERRWLRVRATPMFADQGHTIGQVATLEDVSDLKTAEEGRRASEKQAAAAAQRQTKIEEALDQLREELQRQLQAGAEAQGQAEERLRGLEDAKLQAERSRDELAHRLDESDRARRQAEQTLHGSQLEFARLMDEHLAAKRQAEEALRQARDDFGQQLAAHVSARQEVEEARPAQREEFHPQMEQHASARRHAADALQSARQDHAKEIDKLTNDFLNEMTALEEKLGQAKRSEEEARKKSESLDQETTALQTQLEERDRDLAPSRLSIEELTRQKDRVVELSRPAPPPAPPPREETERNGHPEPNALVVAKPRPSVPSDWLSYN